MKRNQESIERRKEFIQTSITDNSFAATRLRDYAHQLEQSKNTTERVKILSDLLCISETTIFREFSDV